MLSDTEPTRIYKPAHGYNEKLAEESHTMPSGHPEGIYEALANIYKAVSYTHLDVYKRQCTGN